MTISTVPTANPYTAHLLTMLPHGLVDGIAVAEVTAFVADWDRLEAFVIRVFRAGEAGEEDAAEWADLRAALAMRYEGLADRLAIHWPHALVASELCAADPFRTLLAVPTSSALVDNRTAMRTLPAAREALNRWLIVLAGDDVAIEVDGPSPVIPPASPPAPARPTSAGTSTDPAA